MAAWEFLVFIVIIFFNALFVLSEIAIISAKKSKLDWMKNTGNKGASYALDLIKDSEAFLSSVQIGITFLNILVGIYSSHSVTSNLITFIELIPLLKPYSEAIAYVLVVTTMTYIVVLSEIVPKRIAMLFPEQIASFTAYIMIVFIRLIYPIVWAFSVSTRLILKIIKITESEHRVSREEVKYLIKQAEYTGTFSSVERSMMRKFVNLSNIEVGAIMTNRQDVVAINLEDKFQENKLKLTKNDISFFPVIEGQLDNIIGIINTGNLFSYDIRDNLDIKSVASKHQNALYVPEVTKISKLIELFDIYEKKFAIVVNEYGEIEGVITLSDIFKTLLGGHGAFDLKSEILQVSGGCYVVAGNILMAEVVDFFYNELSLNIDASECRTLAGFLLKKLKGVPKVGDSYKVKGLKFEVFKMNKLRIAKVLISSEV